MASRIAHQLRQPLQSIMSEAGTVSSRLADCSDDDDLLRNSVEALQRAVTRLDDYITFMAKATNGLRDTPKTFNLQALVASVVSEFEPVNGSVDVDISGHRYRQHRNKRDALLLLARWGLGLAGAAVAKSGSPMGCTHYRVIVRAGTRILVPLRSLPNRSSKGYALSFSQVL